MTDHASARPVAILMPGDMGHAVGRELAARGDDVITCLEGRSGRTRALAAAAGMRDAGGLEAVVAEAGLILSILPPAAALDQAETVAAAMAAAGARPCYVDCNAVSPDTARRVGDVISGAGAPFLDVGIVGPAPGKGAPPRFYVSGADTGPMAALDGKGIAVKAIGAEVGRASGLKMCYAALTKGTWTLQTAILMCAEVLGLSEVLRDEFRYSQADTYAAMEARLPRLPADSGRWVGEMEEIAATFAAGVTPDFHRGAAEIFRLLAQTPFATETRESIDTDRTLEESVRVYSRQIKR
jgi:3-hydroxyisobutyrate dehydrogenase-like beta-hydroxyacid dehydrogenase